MIQSTHPACLKPLNRAVKANTTERRALPLQFTTTNREEFLFFLTKPAPTRQNTTHDDDQATAASQQASTKETRKGA